MPPPEAFRGFPGAFRAGLPLPPSPPSPPSPFLPPAPSWPAPSSNSDSIRAFFTAARIVLASEHAAFLLAALPWLLTPGPFPLEGDRGPARPLVPPPPAPSPPLFARTFLELLAVVWVVLCLALRRLYDVHSF